MKQPLLRELQVSSWEGQGIPNHSLSCSPGPCCGQSSSVPLEAEGFAGMEGDIFAVAQKAKAFLRIQGPWVLIAACFDHLSPKLLWMCLRANEQVLMLIFCSFCCC